MNDNDIELRLEKFLGATAPRAAASPCGCGSYSRLPGLAREARSARSSYGNPQRVGLDSVRSMMGSPRARRFSMSAESGLAEWSAGTLCENIEYSPLSRPV